MPVILTLLFIVLPFLAALSLEFEGFIAFILVFCVVAGLSDSSRSRASGTAARRRRHRAWGHEVLRPPAAAGHRPVDRLPDTSRV